MELIILGSGTAALQAHRGPSGYALKIGNEICLVDGGTGTLLKALQAGISYQEVDKLFYTHLHPDHTIDLIPFLFATKNTPGFTREKPLEIIGPPGFTGFYEKLVDIFGPGMVEVDYEIKITEVSETSIAFAAFEMQTNRMKHATNAVGYRFEKDDKVLVYSGDTDMCEEIVNLAKDADVLVLECSFHDDAKVAGHLTPSEAGKIAAAAKVKHVILTHLYPPFDEQLMLNGVARFFAGKISIANDLMRVNL